MREELISIIVPVYRVEKYLHECIDSIINQTYKNLEIILVDDGSPDNCGKICDEYANQDSRIKVIHKENGGLSSARNAGLDVAKGEYISFIDSDDCVSEKFIKNLYSLCLEKNVDIAECDFLRFKDKIEKIENDDNTVKLYNNIQMQKKLCDKKEHIKTVIVCNKLYKKEIYKNIRFPIGKINEDEFTTYKAFYNATNDICVSNEHLYYYRYNDNSIMGRQFTLKRLDVLEAYEERKKFYNQKNLKELYQATLLYYQEKLIEYYIFTKQYIEKPKEHLKKIFKYASENYIEYNKISERNLKRKIKVGFFMRFPNLYYHTSKIKRVKKIIEKVWRYE